jgi:hypothetical protein
MNFNSHIQDSPEGQQAKNLAGLVYVKVGGDLSALLKTDQDAFESRADVQFVRSGVRIFGKDHFPVLRATLQPSDITGLPSKIDGKLVDQIIVDSVVPAGGDKIPFCEHDYFLEVLYADGQIEVYAGTESRFSRMTQPNDQTIYSPCPSEITSETLVLISSSRYQPDTPPRSNISVDDLL